MSVEDSQCAAFYTQVGSDAVDTSLAVVQGVVCFLSTIASVLIVFSYVAFKQLRTKSRLLIVHLAIANFMVTVPNFLSVFMNFKERFQLPMEHVNETVSNSTDVIIINITSQSLACSENDILDHESHVYCQVCVYQAFVSIFGVISSIFWTVCVCIHFFILVVYRNPKRASRIAYVYYVIAWLVPLGISLWLLFHNWLGFEPTYSTVNCAIRTQCVPNHRPYQHNVTLDGKNWNRTIGALFGLKIWQALALLIIPCLYIFTKFKNRKRRSRYELYSVITSVAPIKDVERKLLLIPIIFMLMCTASFFCDLYFYINHGGLTAAEIDNAGIIIVHFLIRIGDNSQGLVNFCLFCLLTKEVRSYTLSALRHLFNCKHVDKTIQIPESATWPWIEPYTPTSDTTPGYGMSTSVESNNMLNDNPMLPQSRVL